VLHIQRMHMQLCTMLRTGDPKLDIVQPAVEGTKTVLQAAAKQKANGLQRVVVTSSVCGELACQQLRLRCPVHRPACKRRANSFKQRIP
jgi:nucleoside-diphosphate-sugar epimerase